MQSLLHLHGPLQSLEVVHWPASEEDLDLVSLAAAQVRHNLSSNDANPPA